MTTSQRRVRVEVSMFEAHLVQGVLLKKVFEAIKDLVFDVNIDCDSSGMSLQAMDASHVALVAMILRDSAFDLYRCDTNLSLGMKMDSVSKVFKLCGADDGVHLSSKDDPETLNLTFEDKVKERVSDFELKLMTLDVDHLGIPDTKYSVTIRMPSAEFQRICRDLAVFGDTVTIACTKDSIRFTVVGDIGTGSVNIKARSDSAKVEENVVIDVEEPLEQSFALRYLNYFCKSTPLSPVVSIQMAESVPVVIDYPVGNVDNGHLSFYLAPKMDD